jgi:ABC-type antimicrobial peptide transport system permease subunit
MSTFAGLSLLLAAVGINGVVAYAVALRRREIGIRRAFGATGASVVRLFLSRAMRLVAMGLLVGFPVALAVRWIAVIEWVGSGTSDWLTSLAGVGLVALTGVVAALIPAWRASRLDALDVLRCE